MNAENLRIAIAERCGAKRYQRPWDGKVFLCWNMPGTKERPWVVVDLPVTNVNSDIPAYLRSLDAVHEAILTITDKVMQASFAETLIQLLNRKFDGEHRFIGATPFHVATADPTTLSVALGLTWSLLTPDQAQELLREGV